ncbi:hypothetical protein PCL_03083 [Purpureocillium lilacinum]|uniref:Uncharacterized protein n=1 Tax=Purpureocillium lilacinum TaxID=33203 RepID=A0A2U3DYI1_PURLI|nr:hypothetical protein Purlil1_522 [Purpureocillium lilacinum]PWI67315.1 hypothetical protein PCL_03083 [Purpureocillium lilacinum]
MVSRRQGARRIDEFVEAGAEERGEAEGRATPEPASWCAARAVAAAAAACCCWCRCAAGPQVRKISLPAAGQDWRRVRGPVAGSAALRRGRSKKLEMHSRRGGGEGERPLQARPASAPPPPQDRPGRQNRARAGAGAGEVLVQSAPALALAWSAGATEVSLVLVLRGRASSAQVGWRRRVLEGRPTKYFDFAVGGVGATGGGAVEAAGRWRGERGVRPLAVHWVEVKDKQPRGRWCRHSRHLSLLGYLAFPRDAAFSTLMAPSPILCEVVDGRTGAREAYGQNLRPSGVEHLFLKAALLHVCWWAPASSWWNLQRASSPAQQFGEMGAWRICLNTATPWALVAATAEERGFRCNGGNRPAGLFFFSSLARATVTMREASGERGVATRPGSALTRFSRLDVSKKLGRFWWRLGTTCTVSTPLQEVVVARVEAMVPLFAGE